MSSSMSQLFPTTEIFWFGDDMEFLLSMVGNRGMLRVCSINGDGWALDQEDRCDRDSRAVVMKSLEYSDYAHLRLK